MPVLSLTLTLALPSAARAAADAGRVPWSRAILGTSVLGQKINTEVRLELLPTSSAASQLVALADLEGRQAAGERTGLLQFETKLFGRLTSTRIYFDPQDGDALQYSVQDSGSRHRAKDIRYTASTKVLLRRSPSNKAEESLPEEQWTTRSQEFEPLERGEGVALVEPGALLYLIPASALATPGDSMQVLLTDAAPPLLLEIKVTERVSFAANYQQLEASGEARHRSGEVDALHITLRAHGESSKLELLGLSGDIDMILDSATRAPLSVSGRVKYLGLVTLSLQELQLGPE